MEKTVSQVEKNVSASFGYVKKDMLMLNDAFSDLHDKMQHLSLNHASLLEELGRLRKEVSTLKEKKVSVKKSPKKAVAKKTSKKKEAKKDDLTRVEGIGPAIRKVLYKNNIVTFKKLAKVSTKRLEKILAKAGKKYTLHNPSTWAKQAKLASENKWVELETLQKELMRGIDETTNNA